MLLSCRNIKKSFGDKVVLDNVNLDIERGEKIGLVGRNGTGKTTLANILTGNLDCDEGTIFTSRRQLKIGYLRQTEAEPEVHLQSLNNNDIKGEFMRIASHLGIKEILNSSEERLQNLSGGEKTKLALAKVWAMQPDLVVLDEPTNHMDYEGIKYLVAEIKKYPGAVIIISHDRYFLDQTVDKIVELNKGTVKIYPGNYSSYRETRQRERESQQHIYEAQQKEQRKIEEAIKQLKTWSEKAHRESRKKGGGMIGGKEYFRKKAKKQDKAIKSQIKRLERMRQSAVERPEKETQVNFHLKIDGKRGRRILTADSISKAYGDLILFKDSSFYINRGEKIGIIGPNGCGKTTLINIILGEEVLDEGELFTSPSARIAYVSQELPVEERCSLKDLVKDWPVEEQKYIFELLVGLGLSFDRLSVNLEELSRGERLKVDIALAIAGEYDLLILDEPTNHLDLPSREALEESLLMFPGTIIIVSHDRYLLNTVCDHFLVFDNRKISRIEGKLQDYLAAKERIDNKHGSAKEDLTEELLLLETRISRIIGELSQCTPDDPHYALLDQEYKELIKRRNYLRSKG